MLDTRAPFSVNNAAMLVFLMQAGFTMLEAGSVRERNVSCLLATVYSSIALCSRLFLSL